MTDEADNMVSLGTANALIATFFAPIFATILIFPSLVLYEEGNFNIWRIGFEAVLGVSFMIYLFSLIGCFVFLFIGHCILQKFIHAKLLPLALMALGVLGGALMLGASSAEPGSGRLMGGFSGGVSAVIWLAILIRLNAQGDHA